MTGTTTAPSPAAATTAQPPVALTIAGSEATGGAGAQAGLKTFQELGALGSLALTCIGSSDPSADRGTPPVPGAAGRAGRAARGHQCGARAGRRQDRHARQPGDHGDHRRDPDRAPPPRPRPGADRQGPRARRRPGHRRGAQGEDPAAGHVRDADHFETLSLPGMEEVGTVEHLEEAARRIHETSGAVVLAKDGVRLEGPDAVDVFFDGTTLKMLSEPRVGAVPVAGACCTLAAALVTELAKGAEPLEAARTVKAFVSTGIRGRLSSRAPFDSLWQGGATAEQ